MYKKLEGKVTFGRDASGNITQPYYYFDNPALRVRYFFLYTPGPDPASSYAVYDYNEQLSFLEAKIAELDTGWRVIITQHIIYAGTGTYDADNFLVTKSFAPVGIQLRNFIIANNLLERAKVIAFCGHVHNEFVEFFDDHCVSVCQNCDATYTRYNGNNDVVYPNQIIRDRGSVNEQSFDVYHFDMVANVLYDTKIGFGCDKIANITPLHVAVGDTITLTPTITPESWLSQDDAKATVVGGVVTGVAAGRTTIKARAAGAPNGKWEYFNIVVN